MKKYVVLVFLALVMSAFALAVSYSDVPEDHWAYDAVMKTTSAGLLKGFPNETFQGKEAVTRYQLAEALGKTLNYVDSGDKKLQEIVFALTKKVASLSLEISDSKKAVVDVNNDIDGLKDRVGELEVSMGVVFDQIDSNVFDILDLEDEIKDIKENYVTVENFESTNAEYDEIIEVIFDQIDSNVFDILDIERALGDIETNIATLSENVKSDISSLENKVETLETDM
ncbi:MAG: S-layer homology domain-containing protein, partial [Elusimicrobiota bacterium]